MKQDIPYAGWLRARTSSAARTKSISAAPAKPVRADRRAALIVDKRAVMGTEICRSLSRKGFEIDVLGERSSPAFYSRFCSRRIVVPSCKSGAPFAQVLRDTVAATHYDAIFVCNEEVLETLLDLPEGEALRGFVHSSRETLKAALSKNAMTDIVSAAGIPTPRTILPRDESELEPIARELGYPLVVKGDRGEAGSHVRLVRGPAELRGAYHEIAALEKILGQRPSLQEFVAGTAYSVGGLFEAGRPLRVCAHRKLVTIPPLGGLTVRGVTERPPGLLESAFRVFEALSYTGLGHVELIRDSRGCYRFLEVNPRVWGTIGTAEYAGVDFFTPYYALAHGVRVAPDLRFRDRVRFHRFSREAWMIRRRPLRIFGFIRDCLDPRVKSDFRWLDPGPHLAAWITRSLSLAFGAPVPMPATAQIEAAENRKRWSLCRIGPQR